MKNPMGQIKLLIVDDEKKNLNAVKRIFADEDYTLVTASDGKEALYQVEAHSPALVILDIMMPGMDGVEVCKKIKKKHENTMVLLLSAKSSLKDRLAGYSANADDFLVKPYEPDELVAKANILLRLYNAKQELKNLNSNLESLVEKRTKELIARERQAIVGKMVQAIVHNLRGPLMAAQSSVQVMTLQLDEFLSELNLENSAARKLVDSLKKSNNRTLEAIGKGSKLVDTLLLQGGSNPKEKFHRIDLNELILKELNFLRSAIVLKHRVDVTLDLSEDIPVIQGRYTDFSQVFYNLVKNGCEAMTDSGRKKMTISSTLTPEGIVLSFMDRGTGIDEKKISRIFDPFYTSKSNDSRTDSGSGLGLFICSRLMAEYQAFIKVENREQGGALFSIHIPESNFLSRKKIHDTQQQ